MVNRPSLMTSARKDVTSLKVHSPKHDGDNLHNYFIAKTKGSMSPMDVCEIQMEMHCAPNIFDQVSHRFSPGKLNHDVVDSFGKLIGCVK